MSLTHTLTQTHRHYVARMNYIGVDMAQERGWPLVSSCGIVWIPGPADETAPLPMCPACERVGSRHWPEPGPSLVYRHFDREDRLVYVGCTQSPNVRLQAHRKNTWWWSQVYTTRFLLFDDRSYALRKESEAIVREKPLWNVRGQDYSDMSLAELQRRAAIAVAIGAPEKYLKRFAREALKYHGATLALEAAS